MGRIFVMSDVHGNIDAFHKMLKLINLQKEDKLVILGDVIDRGQYGIELLQEIIHAENITMLPGNHEYMLWQTFVNKDAAEMENWIKHNHGGVTAKNLVNFLHKEEILNFISSLMETFGRTTTVNGQKFYLVHAFASTNLYNSIWCRYDNIPNQIIEDLKKQNCKMVIGHTPVFMQTKYDAIKSNGLYQILNKDNIILIDCGCSHRVPGANLACIELYSMDEYHVKTY